MVGGDRLHGAPRASPAEAPVAPSERDTLTNAVKRHPALVPLSHDHHHALVEARRLRRAAAAGAADRCAAAERLIRFFTNEAIAHFRQEEEDLFPLLVDASSASNDLLVRALLDHQRLHAAVARLRDDVAAGAAAAPSLELTATLLEEHVRFEERQLFPIIEEAVVAASHTTPPDAVREPSGPSPVVDLLAPRGRGPLWGTETEDLNATLLVWDEARGSGEHVNNDVDVLLVVLAGSATVVVDGVRRVVGGGGAVVIEKGRPRSVSAGPDGVRYLSIHRRRPPLRIGRARRP